MNFIAPYSSITIVSARMKVPNTVYSNSLFVLLTNRLFRLNNIVKSTCTAYIFQPAIVKETRAIRYPFLITLNGYKINLL
jgi:hypothetical protein